VVKSSLPGRAVLLEVLKSVEVPALHAGTDTSDTRAIEREVNRLRAKLLRDPKLISLERKVEAIRESRRKANAEKRDRKRELINMVKLAEITPSLVLEVRRFAGIEK
jgi:recombinational DNA repair ATPase RecF